MALTQERTLAPFADLRTYLEALEERALLHRVDAPVDWENEIGAIQRVVFDREGPALYFSNVRDSSIPLVTGLLGTPERMALGLGVENHMRAVIQRVLYAAQNPIDPVIVDQGSCQDTVYTGSDVDVTTLPVPKWHELDGGRYIGTLGLVIAKDPETGIRNIGIYREQIHGKASLSLNATQQVGFLLQKYRRAGKKMPIATVIGVDPCTLTSSCVQARLGDDEFAIAGALLGRPLELVRCVSQPDLEVPANAEIVLEGEIDPEAALMHEGPFGEFTGYYGLETNSPEITLTALTHRTAPVFQGTLEGAPPSESTTIRCAGSTAGVWMKLQAAKVPGVKDVYQPDMACVAFMCIVQLEKQLYFGHARDVMQTVFASVPGAKWVVVVDDDVDIYDRGQVEWALATRVQPHRDIWVTPQNQRGINLDPAIAPQDSVFPNVRTSRVGIDATTDYKGYSFEPLARPEPANVEAALARWDELGIPI